MRPSSRRAALAVALTLIPLAGAQGAQAAPPSRIVTITPATSPQTWQGDTATGTNAQYNFSTGEPCTDTDGVPPADPEYCDITLLHVDISSNPGIWGPKTGGVEVHLHNYVPPSSDFDLQVFASDSNGTKGPLVASSGGSPGAEERATIREPDGWYLIQVVYFAVTNGTHTATVEFFFRDRVPEDIDTPPGLQEILASDASAGWKSRSEPHIAQSPVDPNILVAGSKFYNSDPDALKEYEFKIGTYASFDGGESWSDLGQLNTCPANQAGPETWPNNTCYPADDPTQQGTGLEDSTSGPGATIDAAPGGAQVTVGEHLGGVEFSDTTPLSDGPVGSYKAFVADDTDGCSWTTAMNSGAQHWIGVARRGGTCGPFQAKFTATAAAGADGLIVVNTDDNLPDPDSPPTATAPIAGVLITKSDGDRLINSLVPGHQGEVEATLQIPTGPDFGEEYITSDVWMQFDDEGNAYAMVLDSPPFSGSSGSTAGWGMSLHKWETVSETDVMGGDTWSNRIRINAYPEDFPRDFLGFLDDKNTFAVNNAGPDNDGNTGIIVACWGQNVSTAVKQQIVCERSTNAGASWPGEPVPVSDVEQLVIGVHVMADTQDPDTFYALWLQVASGAGGAPLTIQFARSVDGGQTWVQNQAPAATLTGLPTHFPRQGFRNLSIPIGAVGPSSELYITYADYNAATVPATDEDGKEADIKIVRSTNGGATWSSPVNVTGGHEAGVSLNPNADQFQPYVAVTESGQVNLAYFDRRLDLEEGTGPTDHPGNFFTDVWLSRSNDGGMTFTDTRLSHDSEDPEFNAPVSGSGLFFGDYQGMVTTDCGAIPFFNDSHLANDAFLDQGPERDPDFDSGLPDSPYQQAVNWIVPNSDAYGGPGPLPAGCVPTPPPLCPGFETGFGAYNHVVGTNGSDTLTGTNGPDLICGLGADDDIDGVGGDDLLLGGTGNDHVQGGPGIDELRGDFGADTLQGEGDNDTLKGEDGNDTLQGASGVDDLQGGAGDDGLVGGPGADLLDGGEGGEIAGDTADYSGSPEAVQVVLSPLLPATGGDAAGDTFADDGTGVSTVENLVGSGDGDNLIGNDQANTISGNGGNDQVDARGGADALFGNARNDVLTGGRGPDAIRGGDGADLAKGKKGADRIFGQRGPDDLRGGRGRDRIAGGRGADHCSGGPGEDTITSCEH